MTYSDIWKLIWLHYLNAFHHWILTAPNCPVLIFSSHIFQWHKCHHTAGEVRRCGLPPFPYHMWRTTTSYRPSLLACSKRSTSIPEHVWNECNKLWCNTLQKKMVFISKIWICWFCPLTHSLSEFIHHTVKCTKMCVQVVWPRWFTSVMADKGYQLLSSHHNTCFFLTGNDKSVSWQIFYNFYEPKVENR